MTIENLKYIISQGEGIDVEFKAALFDLPRNTYETICAFLNRKGGTVLLGVEDDGSITGVNESSVSSILDILASDMNNPKVIAPTSYLSTEIYEIDGKKVIYIYVPESSQPHSYKSEYYDRNQDGDFKIRNQHQITNLFIRKQESYTENKVFPYLDMSDFDQEQFDLVRKMVSLNKEKHPWANMTNEEILVSARMRQKDLQTGKEGYTLAAALIFGKEITLASVLPHYKTDALCRKVNTELYDDRDDIRCNLMQAYYRLMDFIHKHLSESPYIEGFQRVSLRELIFREVVANLLIHREFSSSYPATLTIYKNVVVAENWNKPYVMGRIGLENLKPHPKNPIIANFFKQLGWVEELGSGTKKMFKYCPIYVGGATPIIEDGDVFKITIQYNSDDDIQNGGLNPENGGLNDANVGINDENGGLNLEDGGLNGENGGLNLEDGGLNGENGGLNPENGGLNAANVGINPENGGLNDADVGINPANGGLNDADVGINAADVGINDKMLSLIINNNVITIKEISDNLNISMRKTERIIAELKEKGVLRREGSRKSGYWVVA